VWFLLGILTFTGIAGLAWILTQVPLPPEAPQAQTTIIYDASGAQLATLHGSENRFPVKLEQVPKVVQDAVLAAEDRKFFRHGGVDPVGIMRATWADVRHQGSTQGASTITQQYVKNVYVGNDPTLWRKVKEAVIAIKLERKYDKREILERYLNTVYFGRGAYGIQAASRAYFGKDVGQLELKEATYLAGLIRSPTTGDVTHDPVAAARLRTSVLGAMVASGSATSAQVAEVEQSSLSDYVVAPTAPGTTVALKGIGAEYFVEFVRRELVRQYSEAMVLKGGLRVYTSLDPRLQKTAYESVYGLLNRSGDPAGALVSLDPDGRVVAMVGGRDWEASKVNLAVGTDGGGAGRQGGSAFKPFVLAETVREGYSIGSSFPGPAKIVLPKADRGRDWEVTNYENTAYGPMNLVDATANSVNTVYAQLVSAIGPQKVVDMAHLLGIQSSLQAVPSIALGTQNVSVLEMAGAYLTFANKGVQTPPRPLRKVTLGNSVLLDDRPKRTRVLDRDQVEKVDYALEQVVKRGSGTNARVAKAHVRGKTGTSEDFGDAWFVGYTPKLTTAVWMGYPEGQSRPMYNVHGVSKVNGGSLPAQIFQRFMTKAGVTDSEAADSLPDLGGKALRPIIPILTVPKPAAATSQSPTTVPRPGTNPTTTTVEAPKSEPTPTAPPPSVVVTSPAAPPTTHRLRTLTTFVVPDPRRP